MRNLLIILLVFIFISCTSGRSYHGVNHSKHTVRGGAGNTGLDVKKSCSKTTD
ncbi:MAG: hypothetical protein WCL51_03060 [Bacteroidota bacterium]